MLLGDPKRIDQLQIVLSKSFGDRVIILQTDTNLLQIMHPKGGKSSALQWVADHYQIQRADHGDRRCAQ